MDACGLVLLRRPGHLAPLSPSISGLFRVPRLGKSSLNKAAIKSGGFQSWFMPSALQCASVVRECTDRETNKHLTSPVPHLKQMGTDRGTRLNFATTSCGTSTILAGACRPKTLGAFASLGPQAFRYSRSIPPAAASSNMAGPKVWSYRK
jgi:hypothetical protein